MTNVQLDPNEDLHLSSSANPATFGNTSTINPRELSMDKVNLETNSKQNVSLSGIAGISSVAETLKGTKQNDQPVTLTSNNPVQESPLVREEGTSANNSVSQTTFIIVLILFFVALFAAAYFVYSYFSKY